MAEGEMIRDASGGSKPVPDPTTLTTEQLMREISRLEETVGLHIKAAEERLQGEINLTTERFQALRKALDERYATQQFAIQIAASSADGAKKDSKELFDARLEALREMLNERYATQTKALDAAFLAQQAAMTTANSTAEKAVQAALLAAEKAVDKANTASEKRFEAVNEFRGQLNDVMQTMMPRTEAESKFEGLDGKIDDIKSSIDKGFSANTAGDTRGREIWGYIVGAIGVLAAIGLLIVTMIHIGH